MWVLSIFITKFNKFNFKWLFQFLKNDYSDCFQSTPYYGEKAFVCITGE